MGLSQWHLRKAENFDNRFFVSVLWERLIELSGKFMAIGAFQVSEWFLVSLFPEPNEVKGRTFLKNDLRLWNRFSISGSTSTIFAYLGEFLGAKNRSRSMMLASVVFGVCSLVLPLIAWVVINQHWSFVIPILQVNYKPWRLFMLTCGLQSFLCGITLIFFPESPKFTFAQVID